MKQRKGLIALIGIIIGVSLIYYRKPIITGELTKQTLFLWLLNVCHVQAKDAQPLAMIIDDDSEKGIYTIRQICEELGIKATFAVIPSRFTKEICDSLKHWQQEGYGIALHGYNHERWKEWSEDKIINDITRSEELLEMRGFRKDFKYVVPPHACNTSAIRRAIKLKGYKMICGANIINPDESLFQYGRMSFNKDMSSLEMQRIRDLLTKAFKEKAFVIFGTHSSMEGSFSEEKTKAVLQMAKNIGFKFI